MTEPKDCITDMAWNACTISAQRPPAAQEEFPVLDFKLGSICNETMLENGFLADFHLMRLCACNNKTKFLLGK